MAEILGVQIPLSSNREILDTVKKAISKNVFAHIVSLNPEILVKAQHNSSLKKIIDRAEVKLIDGVGIILAAKLLGYTVGERFSGVDLMQQLIELADALNLRVLIVGGFETVAFDLAEKLQKKYKNAQFKGLKGYKSVKHPSTKEERNVQQLLKEFKPNLVFVAFGAPAQEEWVESHKQFLKSSVCMAVGGAVDFLEGKVQRAPRWMQKAGLEWLFRLIKQPWRWKRQIKLLTFIRLVLKQRFKEEN